MIPALPLHIFDVTFFCHPCNRPGRGAKVNPLPSVCLWRNRRTRFLQNFDVATQWQKVVARCQLCETTCGRLLLLCSSCSSTRGGSAFQTDDLPFQVRSPRNADTYLIAWNPKLSHSCCLFNSKMITLPLVSQFICYSQGAEIRVLTAAWPRISSTLPSLTSFPSIITTTRLAKKGISV